MRLNTPLQIDRYLIAGCDDWLVFAYDQDTGQWVYWDTECDPAWNEIARATGRSDAGLGDDPPAEIIAVGVLMARRGDPPRSMLSVPGADDGTIADLERHFGDPDYLRGRLAAAAVRAIGGSELDAALAAIATAFDATARQRMLRRRARRLSLIANPAQRDVSAAAPAGAGPGARP